MTLSLVVVQPTSHVLADAVLLLAVFLFFAATVVGVVTYRAVAGRRLLIAALVVLLWSVVSYFGPVVSSGTVH